MGKGKSYKTGAFSDSEQEDEGAPELPVPAASKPAPSSKAGHACPHESPHDKAHG